MSSTSTPRRRPFAVALLLAASMTVTAGAQETAAPGPLGTSCFVAPARMADADIQAFLDDPAALLTTNPSGGLPLQNRVRSLVGSSSVAFDAILALIPTANENQAAAIGSGLARTVNACQPVDPDYADAILVAVGDLTDENLLVAFNTSLQETAVGAIGAGNGGPAITGGTPLTEAARNASGSNGTSFGGDVFVLTQDGTFTVGSAGNFIAASASAFSPE